MARINKRLKILQTGAEIVHKKGFNYTGIKEILDAAGVPKGSFYYYFKSKDDFGLQLLDYYGDFFVGKLRSIRNEYGDSAISSLRRLFGYFLDYFRSNGCEKGCPIGNLSQEMGDLNPAFRIKLEEIFSSMRNGIAGLLQKAIEQGEIRADLDAESMADFILNSWEGAITRMKVQKSVNPLLIFDRMIFEGILPQSKEEES